MTQDSSVTNSPISLTGGWLGALQPNGTSFFLLHWPPPWWAGGPRVGSSSLSWGGAVVGRKGGGFPGQARDACTKNEINTLNAGFGAAYEKEPRNLTMGKFLEYYRVWQRLSTEWNTRRVWPQGHRTAQGKLTSRNRERSRIKATIFQRRKLTTTTSSDAPQARAGVKRWNIWVVPAVNGTSTVNVPARTSTIAAVTSHETCHYLCSAKIAYRVDT